MKIELLKEKVFEAIASAEKISGKNLTLPVLHCVLLKAEGKQLTIRATNLELGIEIAIPAKVEQEGVVAVPGSILASVISAAPVGATVTFQTEGKHLLVTHAGSETRINTMEAEDFPGLPRAEGGTTMKIKADDLIRGIKAVSYCASTSTIKPELGSVYVQFQGSKILFVATDSFRLAEKTVSVKQAVVEGSVLIPARSVSDIVRVLESAQGDVETRYNEHQISFTFDTTYLTSRLVEGAFPDYVRIVPQESSTEATLLKQDLLQTLKKTSIFSDRFHQVRFDVDPKKKACVIHADSAEIGETTDEVQAALKGEPIQVSFNQRYISDCFQSIASDSITLFLAGAGRPMIIRGVSDPSFFYLVMPMNK